MSRGRFNSFFQLISLVFVDFAVFDSLSGVGMGHAWTEWRVNGRPTGPGWKAGAGREKQGMVTPVTWGPAPVSFEE